MISNKTISAIEVCLGIAQMQASGPVTGTALSQRLHLSISHLENILKQLKQGRIIASVRGPGGGYTLTQALDHTTLWDIAAVFEKTLQNTEKMGVPSSLAAPYEWALEGVVVAYLQGIVLSDVLNESFMETAHDRRQQVLRHGDLHHRSRGSMLVRPSVGW
jgi:Rrf2 family iron-sulfur cluster assembly transcriptional regulator